MNPKWLEWAAEIQRIAQAGIEYSKDVYDIGRFERLRSLSTEIVSTHTEYDTETVRLLFANETGYQTPKLDVRAVVPRNGALLFVKEVTDGLWALPGGWAEPGYTLMENAAKEVREEAGMKVKPRSLIAILDRERHIPEPYPYAMYKCFVLCTPGEGEFEENLETLDAAFFDENDLPPLSEGRNSPEMIRMCFDAIHGRNGSIILD